MTNSGGIVRLEIARLERQLEVYKQQTTMCARYPDHIQKLIQIQLQLQTQLDTLIKKQQTFVPDDIAQDLIDNPGWSPKANQ